MNSEQNATSVVVRGLVPASAGEFFALLSDPSQ